MLPRGILAGSAHYPHPDYPLLVPVLQATWFHLVGAPDMRSAHLLFWLIDAAAMGAIARLASRRAPVWAWAPLLALLAAAPAVTGQLMTEYADIPMALLLMTGTLSLGLWLQDRHAPDLRVAVLLLAGAASTKNEGLTAAVAVLAAAVLVGGGRAVGSARRSGRLVLIGALAIFAVLIAPWRLWLAAHHISGDMPVGSGLTPGYLLARQLAEQGSWLVVTPLAIFVIASCVLLRRDRAVAVFYLLGGSLAMVGLLWGYVINPYSIGWYIATSASRTVDGIQLIALAALLQLVGGLCATQAGPATARATDAVADAPSPVWVDREGDPAQSSVPAGIS
jgi:hypothetical protein